MAVKEYGYYIKGNKVAIVEKDTRFDNDTSSKDYGPGANIVQWKSPLSTVADGLELQYVYSPDYFINETDDVDQNITHYRSNAGYLELSDRTSAYTNYVTAYSLSYGKSGSYIVLRNAGRFNGLHQVQNINDEGAGTNNVLQLYTKYSGSQSSWVAFEETPSVYYNVSALVDESSVLDLPSYLSKALVYYVKAKMLEDQMNIEGKEYFMKEFRKMVEKYNNTRISGLRIQVPGPHSIK